MDCIPYVNDLLIEIDILNSIDIDDEDIKRKIKEKQDKIDMIKDNLSKISINSVEYRLYLKILNGKTPTQAVNEIADENYIHGTKPTDISTIWTNYYRKIKKYL